MSYFTSMPPRNDPSAPTFDDTYAGLKNYFADLEYLFEDAGILTDHQKKRHAVRYLNSTMHETWIGVHGFQDTTISYAIWNESIFKLYPDSTSVSDLVSLASTTPRHPIPTEQDLAQYFRAFTFLPSRLLSNGRVSL